MVPPPPPFLISPPPHPLDNNNTSAQVWNDDLAMVAQNYAEQCVFEHNDNRVSQQSTFSSVGENLAATTGSANYTRLVRNWYDENQDYDFSSRSCANVCGHYTQVGARP
jgi:hypothetical protein